jgi:hypothetical protein
MSPPRLTSLLFLATLATLVLSSSDAPHDDTTYLQKTCFPNLMHSTLTYDIIASLPQSPFPCEIMAYISAVCRANGTTTLDYEAEQQCFCTGSYATLFDGCLACFQTHGLAASAISSMASVNAVAMTAMCSTTPVTRALADIDQSIVDAQQATQTGVSDHYITIVRDLFPSDTAVSNYFTATGAMTPGAITGEATGRRSTSTMWGESHRGYTTTSSVAAAVETTTSGTASVSTQITSAPVKASVSSVVPSAAAVSTTSTAGAAEMKAAGAFVAAVLGAIMLL